MGQGLINAIAVRGQEGAMLRHNLASRPGDKEAYYSDLGTDHRGSNIHWKEKLGPVYGECQDLDAARYAYPQGHDLKKFDPPETSDPPHRVTFPAQQNAEGYHARNDALWQSRNPTYVSQIDLSGHAHAEQQFTTPPTRVDPVTIKEDNAGRGYKCRVRGQADDYSSSLAGVLRDPVSHVASAHDPKVKIPARSAVQ